MLYTTVTSDPHIKPAQQAMWETEKGHQSHRDPQWCGREKRELGLRGNVRHRTASSQLYQCPNFPCSWCVHVSQFPVEGGWMGCVSLQAWLLDTSHLCSCSMIARRLKGRWSYKMEGVWVSERLLSSFPWQLNKTCEVGSNHYLTVSCLEIWRFTYHYLPDK